MRMHTLYRENTFEILLMYEIRNFPTGFHFDFSHSRVRVGGNGKCNTLIVTEPPLVKMMMHKASVIIAKVLVPKEGRPVSDTHPCTDTSRG